eukprot:5740994-Prymnesium_polylepis.1
MCCCSVLRARCAARATEALCIASGLTIVSRRQARQRARGGGYGGRAADSTACSACPPLSTHALPAAVRPPPSLISGRPTPTGALCLQESR